jgi:RHS repeat-associated protein
MRCRSPRRRAFALALLPLLALGAQKGDVSLDGTVNARDVLLLDRTLRGDLVLGAEAEEAGDVAPLGPPLGDGVLGPADLRVLLRAMEGDDLDGDGLPAEFEARAGTFPFTPDSDGNGVADDLEDSDGDGIANGVEYGLGTDPGSTDSDGDGIPDWAEAAEAPAQGVATNLEAAVSFLYEGPGAIQTGVAPGTIEPLRVAVLRGRVLTPAGAGIGGVTVRVKDHAELGETRTRGDGAFDLAVNGGGVMTVEYAKPGLLPAQRQVTAPWQEFAGLPDVVLVAVDSAMTPVTLGAGAWQVVSATPVVDTSGTRRARLFVPPGLSASFVLPGGGTASPTRPLELRLTEYTVGDAGPEAMPGLLPPSSAYTYAIEISADEAAELGASHIRFRTPGGSEPRPVLYLENFLGFPVGMPVPWGSYDRETAGWSAEESGCVVQLVDAGGGALGFFAPGGPGECAPSSVLPGELDALAGHYAAGAVLWRVPLAQASPGDGNLTPSPPPGAIHPPPPAPNEEPPPDCSGECGSILRAERRSVGEAVALVGMPFRLHYESDRTPGYLAARRLEIPLVGEGTLPGSLDGMELRIDVGGLTTHVQRTPAETEPYPFEWSGQSAYGQTLRGRQPITIALSYRYPFAYRWTTTFNQPGSDADVAGGVGRNLGALSSEWRGRIGAFDARDAGLGGWTLAIHHHYDPYAKVLYKGDGTRETTKALPDVIATAAEPPDSLFVDHQVAAAPDGTVYVSTGGSVHRVEADSTTTTPIVSGLGFVSGLAVGPGGDLYVAQGSGSAHRISRVTPGGAVTPFAGTGAAGFAGDGGPALDAQLSNPGAMVLAPDGTLFVADFGNGRVRKIEPNGVIRTVAGGVSGNWVPTEHEGKLATAVPIGSPSGLALGPDGTLYLAAASNGHQYVRSVSPSGIIRVIAGDGQQSCSDPGDGEPATSTCTGEARGLAWTPEGGLLFASRAGGRVRRLAPPEGAGETDWTISTVAGVGPASAPLGDGGPASAAKLETPTSLALAPGGALYVAEANAYRVRRIEPALPAYDLGTLTIASRDGSELYVFDPTGRHQETLEPRTRQALWQFEYNADGTLQRAVDADDNEYRVQRDGAGEPVGLLAELGAHLTELEVDANGWLETIRSPADEAHAFTYTAEGLLQTYTAPAGGGARTYSYDPEGRLDVASDPAGGSKAFTSPAELQGPSALGVRVETGEGRITTYEVLRQADRDEVRHTRLHVGGGATLDTKTLRKRDGTAQRTDPDGTVVTVVEGPDPEFGLMAPLPSSFDVLTPPSASAPAGRLFSGTYERTKPVSGPGGVVTAQTDTLKIYKPGTQPNNVRVYTQAYAASTSGPEAATVTTTTPEGRVIADTLDGQGRLLSRQVGSLEAVRFGYDAVGRLETISQGAGVDERTTTFTYDPTTGFLAGIEDPLERTLAIDAYDAAGRPTQETLPGGRVVGFGWDANGNLTSLTPPGKPAHAFRYTPVDQEREYEPPAVAPSPPWITETTWDGDRRLERVDRPDGTAIELAYEVPSGRLGSVTIPDGTIDLGYHPTTGQLETLSAPGGGALALGWNGFLLESQTWSGAVAGSVGFDYESPGLQLAEETVNGANAVSFSYDDDGLLTGAGALILTPDGGHGLLQSTELGVVATGYGYSPFGELSSDSASVSGSPVYANTYPVRDPLGRIVQKVETIQGATTTWDYTYDPAGRLDTVMRTPSGGSAILVADYAYDANGNRLCTNASGETCPGGSASYDEQDRLVADEAGRSYAYTEAGELKRVTEGGSHTLYRTDALGGLRSVCLASTDPDTCTGGTEIAYEIDALGRRIGKKVNATLQKGYLWSDGLRVAAELDATGALVSRFVYGTRPNVPEYMVKDGATYRILADHLGSVRLVVNAATGALAQRIDYDAWGIVLADSNPGFQPFGFAGGLYDPDTGLVRFGARDYDARIGRWSQKDPVRFESSELSLFAYAVGDPINSLDPRGDTSITAGGYFGWGGTVTVGWTPGGSFFASLRGGVGFGFEATLDPSGVPPGYGCDNPQAGATGLGVFGEAGIGAGPVGRTGTKNAGGLLFAPTPTRGPRTGGFNTTNVSPVFSPQRAQVKWGASAGVQLDFFSNDPECGCSN